MKRREFMILSGVGATGATLLSACGHPEEKLIPAFVPDDEYVPGIDYWKASTCGMCDAGCGIIVRTREHKANKIEGNPLHPVNRGALCARGQAGLQVLYNPNRIRGPLKRKGERGAGQWEEISWDEAIKTLVGRLSQVKQQNLRNVVSFAFQRSRGVTNLAMRVLKSAIGAPASGFDSNTRIEPVYDIANATYLLSFGARFLETWQSPVMYSLAYGEFRRSAGRPRGRFVQVEPRMSLTGANADEWLPVKPGGEQLAAKAIAQVIARERLIKDAPPALFNEVSADYAPERTAEQSGITVEKVIRIAREFAAAERPLAIGGGASAILGAGNSPATDFLNKVAGRIDKPGGVVLPLNDNFNPFADLLLRVKLPSQPDNGELDRLLSGQRSEAERSEMSLPADHVREDERDQILLVHHANPVYLAPDIAHSIRKISFIASFSSFMDETTQLADLVLPDHSYLERWDIQATSVLGPRIVLSVVQPVIKPQFNTRQTADVLLGVSRELGLELANAKPFDSAESLARHAAASLFSSNSATEDQDEEAFKHFSETGVWVKSQTREKRADGHLLGLFTPIFEVSLEAEGATDGDYPLTLLTYEHASLGYGELANLPLLQELPDPMTSVMWGSWVEIHPATAVELGIADGDLVEVTSKLGSIRLPAVFYRAIRPDVVAIPLGQGHTAYGSYASARGANPAALEPVGTAFAQEFDRSSGATKTMLLDQLTLLRAGGESLVGESLVGVKVTKATGSARLIRFGTDLQEQMEKRR